MAIQITDNLSTVFTKFNAPLSKVFHDSTLYGDGTRTSPLRVLGGGGTWGSITGTLSSQTDLQTALNNKLSTTGSTSTLAWSTALLTLSGTQSITDTIAAGSGALAGSALDITQTWNTSGDVSAIKVNVTNTASGGNAALINLQVAGVTKFIVYKAGAIETTAGITMGNANAFRFGAQSTILNSSDGVILLSNNAITSFNRLQLGGTTSSFPSLKRNATEVQARLADDSDFAPTQSLYQRFGSGTPEGVVTAPVGAIYHRTNGGAGTSLYVKESGVGNTGWIAK